MRYENPLHLAEEAAALDLLSDGRVALGVSRGSPEPALRGWETFGYTGAKDPRGADLARAKFDLFLRAVHGEALATADPEQYGPGRKLAVEPHSPGLDRRIWWGAGSRDTAEQAGRMGVNLMSSTLLTRPPATPSGTCRPSRSSATGRPGRRPDTRAAPGRPSPAASSPSWISGTGCCWRRRHGGGPDRHHRRVPRHLRPHLCGRAG